MSLNYDEQATLTMVGVHLELVRGTLAAADEAIVDTVRRLSNGQIEEGKASDVIATLLAAVRHALRAAKASTEEGMRFTEESVFGCPPGCGAAREATAREVVAGIIEMNKATGGA